MMQKKILIIDHNEKNIETLTNLLESSGHAVMSIATKEQFDDIIRIDVVDLFLVNAHVNFVEIEDIFEAIDFNFTEFHPVVFIDSLKEHNRKKLYECYEYGCTDYIKKPFDSKEIAFRINNHIKHYAKAKECKLRVEKLSNLATTDQVSKLTSKAHMLSILKHTIDVNSRHHSDTCLIYLRLIEIDKVFSTFGFGYGEKLISVFAKSLKKLIRESDVAGRWVGVDFVILFPYTDINTAQDISKKLYKSLITTEIAKGIKPNMAIGVAEVLIDDSSQEVIEKAKHAMKEAAKDRYEKISIYS